jgi:hypothetical protein
MSAFTTNVFAVYCALIPNEIARIKKKRIIDLFMILILSTSYDECVGLSVVLISIQDIKIFLLILEEFILFFMFGKLCISECLFYPALSLPFI